MTTKTSYAMTVRVDLSHERAMQAVEEELERQGFGVLTRIDVRKTMHDKLEAEFPDYVILGVCNPALAYMVLRDDIDAGLLLPCKVVVRTDPSDERTVVSVLDPMVMAEIAGNDGVSAVAPIVREKLGRVLEGVKGVAQ